MIFGKTIFYIRCPYHSCRKILGEVDEHGRVKIKSKRSGISVVSPFIILICSSHNVEIHWKSKEILKLTKGK